MPSATFFRLPERKRERLLLAARTEFARVPYDQASINQIVRMAGIPRGSFYMYFQDKEELLSYLLEDHFQYFTAWIIGLLRREGGDLFAAFRRFFDQMTGRSGDEAQLRELMAILRVNAGLQQGTLLRSISPSRLMEPLLPEIDRSRLSLRREEDLEEIVHILISVTMPALCAAASQEPGPVRERYLARLDILSRGMTARQPAELSSHLLTAKEF